MQQSIKRPGIINLESFGVRHSANPLNEVGISDSGLLIPFPHVVDGFHRLRLDRPTGDKRYHQRAGSSPHVWLPPTPNKGDLIIVEGEFKAMALCEAGYHAAGMSGFYGCMVDGRIHPELVPHITETVYMLGDGDTALNPAWADAVLQFRKALSVRTHLRCPRLPYCGTRGKGVDDIRESFFRDGDSFRTWFDQVLNSSVEIGVKAKREDLVVRFAVLAESGIRAATDDARDIAQRKLVDCGRACGPLGQERLGRVAKEALGIASGTWRRAMTARDSDDVEQAAPRVYDVEVFNRILLVAGEWYHVVGGEEKKGSIQFFAPTRTDLIDVELRSAGFSPAEPLTENVPVCGGSYPISELAGAYRHLHWQRVAKVGFELFRPYGRLLADSGERIFNQCRHDWIAEAGDVNSWDDPRIRRTALWLRALMGNDADADARGHFVEGAKGGGIKRQPVGQLDHLTAVLADRYQKARAGIRMKCLAIMFVGPMSAGKSLFLDFFLSRMLGQPFAGDGLRLFRGENGGSSVLQYATILVSDQDIGEDRDAEVFRCGVLKYLSDHHAGSKLMNKDVAMTTLYNQFAFASNPQGKTLNVLRGADETVTEKMAVYVTGVGFRALKEVLTADELARPSKWLEEELPFVLGFLGRYAIPEARKEPRFGVVPYMHPEVQALMGLSGKAVAVREILRQFQDIWDRTQEELSNLSSTKLYSIMETLEELRGNLRSVRPEDFLKCLIEIAYVSPELLTMKVFKTKSGAVKNRLFTLNLDDAHMNGCVK